MNIKYSKQAEKFLDGQNNRIFARITLAIDKLPDGDVKKMAGYKDKYRLRIGGFRVVFTMKENDIIIEKIDNRGQIYK